MPLNQKKKYKIITFRRYYLDLMLSQVQFFGKVLDIGGKKNNKRGFFRPPLDIVKSWEYVNIDKTTRPDYLCSADSICVEENSFDIILLTEVLEHILNPTSVIQEAKRILKPKGLLIITMPFLYPIHADPDDFQRWTPNKIKLELTIKNFEIVHLEPMGSLFAVMYDLLHVSLGMASKNKKALKNRIITKLILPVIAKFCLYLDKYYYYKSNWITTGYFIIGRKYV